MKTAKKYGFKLNNYYLTLLASFLLTVIFSLGIFGIILDYYAIRVLKQEINRSNINALNQTQYFIDAILKQIDSSEIQLSLDPYISRYLTLWPEFDLIELGKIQTVLSNVKSSNENIHSMYLYYPNSNFIITSFGQFRTDTFTDMQWLNEAQKEEDRKFWMKTREIVDFEKKITVKVVTYIRKLPFHKKLNRGYIVANVYESTLHDKISSLDLGKNGYVFIINNRGELITHSSKKLDNIKMKEFYEIKNLILKGKNNSIQKINNSQVMLSEVTSDFNQWKYVTVQSVTDWVSKTHIITKITVIAASIAMIIAIIFSYLFSRYMYFPVRKLLNWMNNPKNDIRFRYKEFDIINSKLSEIVLDNQNLNLRLWRAKPTLQEKFLFDIVTGNIKNEKKIVEMLEFLEIDLKGMLCYISVVMEIDNFESFSQQHNQRDQSLYKFAIRNITEEIMLLRQAFGLIAETKPNRMVVIIGFKDFDKKEERVIRLFGEVSSKIAEILPLTVTIGIGDFYNRLSDICSSYNEASEAVSHRIILGRNQVIMYNSMIMLKQSHYIYPLEQEEKLRNALKIGSVLQIRNTLNDTINEITKSYVINSRNLKQVFFHIINAVVRSIYEVGYDLNDVFEKQYDIYSHLNTLETLDEIQKWLEEICTRVGEFISIKRENKNMQVLESITSFIEKNYDKDIALDVLSENVLYSASYINKLLRNHFGKTFYELVTEKRIEMAKKFLVQKEFQINVVAEMTGYNNVCKCQYQNAEKFQHENV